MKVTKPVAVAIIQDKAIADLLAKKLVSDIEAGLRVQIHQRQNGSFVVQLTPATEFNLLNMLEIKAYLRGFFSHDINCKYEKLI